jgi:uncharacterized protein (TIGR03083 family)
MNVDNAAARASLGRAADRVAALIRGINNAGVRMPSSEWTIAEAAAHMISSLRTYGGAATGEASLGTLDRSAGAINDVLAGVNRARMQTVQDRSPGALADAIVDAVQQFLRETDGMPGDAPYDWYGTKTTLGAMTGVQLAELLVHGYDIARTVNVPWPISNEDAIIMIMGGAALLPNYVVPEATRKVHAAFEIRIRGGESFGVRVDDGTATVTSPPVPPFDVHVSADPVTMLLISYGRIGLAKPVLTGKVTAWGRKPWLGLKFKKLFLNP